MGRINYGGVARYMSEERKKEAPATRHAASASSGAAPHRVLYTLDEARLLHDGVVILQGKGRTYVVCPAARVDCWEPVLKLLLRDLETIACPLSSRNARIRYKRLAPGTAIPGGGEVTAGAWIAECFVELGLERAIHGVLRGRLGRLPFRERLRHAVRNGIRQVQSRNEARFE